MDKLDVLVDLLSYITSMMTKDEGKTKTSRTGKSSLLS